MIAVLNAYTLSECMEIMADYAAAYESRGGRNLIFCEDRLTLIAEQALTRKTGGTFFSSVTTFARFLKTDERILTKQGSVMAIGEIMTELQRKRALKCFTSASGIKNNAKCIYETVAQLAASEVTPETLAESLSLLPQDMLKDKVSDLAAIYEGYTAFLREKGYVDESRYLSLLPDCIRRDANLRGTNIFFLCFTSFTAQAAEAIRAAAEAGANVLGIFCSGKEEIYTNRAFSAFTKACEGYGKVQVRSLGTPLEGEAEVLRAGLFNPERLAGERMKTDKIRIFEAEDKSGEAEYIAANIKKLLAERPALRYRDIAVFVPDMAGYSLPFKKTFDEYGIQTPPAEPIFVELFRRRARRLLARGRTGADAERLFRAERRLPQLSFEICQLPRRREAGDQDGGARRCVQPRGAGSVPRKAAAGDAGHTPKSAGKRILPCRQADSFGVFRRGKTEGAFGECRGDGIRKLSFSNFRRAQTGAGRSGAVDGGTGDDGLGI